jgi:plastocyanin
MSSLDSRFLHVGDCYGHRFTQAGAIPYQLSRSPLPAGEPGAREPAQTIVVAEASGGSSAGQAGTGASSSGSPEAQAGARASSGGSREAQAGAQPGVRQHNVSVREVDGALQAEPAQLQIAIGDAVLWVPDKTVRTGFCVRASDGETFDSSCLRKNSLYTHAFARAGHYRWRDAHGSALQGEVLARMPEPASAARGDWLRALSQGTVVHIGDERATPALVEILVGQTVAWAVERAPGVSVTDVTLLGAGYAATGGS